MTPTPTAMRRVVVCLFIVGSSAGTPAAPAAASRGRAIDASRSTVKVFVYKSGLFSALADNHIVEAPVTEGAAAADLSSVDATVRTADLRVLDPDQSADRRREVQARMLGPEVLDAERYPEVRFVSTRVDAGGPDTADRWRVAGRLTIHGQTRDVELPVARDGDVYRGAVKISQRDFGISPISIAGGAVKVKDELRIEFAIVLRASD